MLLFEEQIDGFRLQIGTQKSIRKVLQIASKYTPICIKNAVKIVSEMYAKWCRNCVQKQCANCVAKIALFVCQKRCCKVMQMNTLRMLSRARVNKQTNEQTNKTPIGVREKRFRKDEDEGRILRSHSFPFLANAKTKSLSPFAPMSKNTFQR